MTIHNHFCLVFALTFAFAFSFASFLAFSFPIAFGFAFAFLFLLSLLLEVARHSRFFAFAVCVHGFLPLGIFSTTGTSALFDQVVCFTTRNAPVFRFWKSFMSVVTSHTTGTKTFVGPVSTRLRPHGSGRGVVKANCRYCVSRGLSRRRLPLGFGFCLDLSGSNPFFLLLCSLDLGITSLLVVRERQTSIEA